MNAWLARLNDDQRAAATAVAREVHIVASAGSGKTTVLVARVCELIAVHEVPADEIQVVCFTRGASATVRSRIRDTLGEVASGVHVDTFHGMAMRLLRRWDRIEDRVSMASEGEEDACLRSIFDGPSRRPEASKTCMRDVRRTARLYATIGPDHSASEDHRHQNPRAHAVYEQWVLRLWREGRIIMDDVLPALERAILAGKSPPFRHALVDEAHDATPLEWAVARALTSEGVTMVYDPRQAIFGWRGGMDPTMLSATGGPDLDVIALPTTYRFGSPLLDMVNTVAREGVKGAEDAVSATGVGPTTVTTVRTKGTEPLFSLVRDMQTRCDTVGVLARTNDDARRAKEALGEIALMQAKPVIGQETAIIILCTRLSVNPDDDMAFAKLWPQTHLGESRLHQLMARAGRRRKLLAQWGIDRRNGTIEPSAREGYFFDAIMPPAVAAEMTVFEMMSHVNRTSRPHVPLQLVPIELMSLMHNRANRDTLDAMMVAIRDHNTNAADIARMTHGAVVSTVHGAKGEEFDGVVVVGTPAWPTLAGASPTTDEEHRVFYVALTRARKECVIYINEDE